MSRRYHSSENTVDGSVTGRTPQQGLGADRSLDRRRRTGGQPRDDRERTDRETSLPDEQTPSPQQDRQPLGVLSNNGLTTMSNRSMAPSMMAPSPLRTAGNLSETSGPRSISVENARPTIWSEWHAQLTQAPNEGFGPITSTPNSAAVTLVTPNDLRQYCWMSNNNQPNQPTARRLFTSPKTPKIRPRRRQPISNSRSRTLQLPVESVSPTFSGSAADIELLSADIDNMSANDTADVEVEVKEERQQAILGRANHFRLFSPQQWRRQRLLRVVTEGTPPATPL